MSLVALTPQTTAAGKKNRLKMKNSSQLCPFTPGHAGGLKRDCNQDQQADEADASSRGTIKWTPVQPEPA
jgi:hypothetical protein